MVEPEFRSWENCLEQDYVMAARVPFCPHVEQFKLRRKLNVEKLLNFKRVLSAPKVSKNPNADFRLSAQKTTDESF